MSKVHWLALSSVPGVGGVTAKKLIGRFGDIEAVFDTPDEDLLTVPRVTPDMVARLRAISLESLEEELASLGEEGIQVFTWDDEEYPANLRPTDDSPPVLFVSGDVRPEDERAVAIVGTREPTPSAVERAETIARELAARGWTIVSGLALGIDTAAHRGALKADEGRTLAVLGSGLRTIHPRENARLAEEIICRGALLSEFHPNSPPRGQNLMARDRIVSGLSRAVIVVEAGEKSGSLDTAAKARRQGRPVWAVPGSPGTDLLIKNGQAKSLDFPVVDWDRFSQGLPPTIDTPARDEGVQGQNQLSLF